MEKKIILNDCYGGLCFSRHAMVEVLKRKGMKPVKFIDVRRTANGYDKVECTEDQFLAFEDRKRNGEEELDDYSFSWGIKVDADSLPEKYSDFDREEIERVEKDFYEDQMPRIWGGLPVWIGDKGFHDREDPETIAVIEEFGTSFCAGDYGAPCVETFDDNDGLFMYTIDEYDGWESLEIKPNLTEERIRKCESIDDVIDILYKARVLRRRHYE